jgi:signal transduction histidine kinase/DNA-binding response OmpR family regulator/CHASE3 domain sensor protein
MKIIKPPGLLRNLQIGFGLSLMILIVSSVASYTSIQGLLESSRQVDHTDSVIKKLEMALSTLKDAETGQRGYLLTGDTSYLRPYAGAQEKALTLVNDVTGMTIDNPTQSQNSRELYEIISQRLSILQQLIDNKRDNNLINLAELKKGQGSMEEARRVVARMQDEEHRLMRLRVEKMNKFSNYTPVLIIVAAALSLLITLFFYRRVVSDYQERITLFSELQLRDEDIRKRIDIISDIADKVSEGNYQVRVSDEQKDSLGALGGSLNKMAESLDHSFRLLSDNEWLQAGLARLNEIMVGEADMKALSAHVIDFITEYSHSMTGAFYRMDPDSRELTLESGHGLVSGSGRTTVPVGDGMAGQVAMDGKRILVKDIPPGDWVVSWAAGSLKPRTMVAFAFFYEKKIKGVIELGSLDYYTERDLAFFSNIGESIGTAVNGIETRLRLQDLLEETQAQAEELQAQQSELENMNMELEIQAEKLQVSEEELKVQQEELQQTNQELEERSRSLEEKNQLILIRNLDIQKKAEELAQTTKYKSEFMANMSHELRTPLNSILLLSRLLSDNNSQNLSADQIEYARVIQNSGQGLLELIDEILDLSRIESGKLQLEYSIVTVDELVTDMRMLFDPLAKDKNLDLKFIVDEGTSAKLETDKMRLEQILKNLLSNAFKFTAKGYVQLRISPSFRKNHIDLAVRDSGIGIPEDKHQLIFEAFQQADGSTRRQYGGTGLGLSISRELSRLLGGDITLTSSPDEGAEFRVTIPQFRMEEIQEMTDPEESKITAISPDEAIPQYTLAEIPPDIPDDRSNILPGDKVLLIVEDDRYFARSLLDFGRNRGYKGIISVRGDKATGLAKAYKPVGILLDIQLPVKSGWDVMEELKKEPKTRHIPVHIISSFEVKSESMTKGAFDYISKPAASENMAAVFERIEYVLNRSSKKVLIVEDNTKHAEALSYFLGVHHVSSEIAQTVAGSIAALEKEEVQCSILTREGADDSERGSLDTIRKHPGLENIPIIVLTGKTISRGEEVRLRQYADSIVVKTAHSYQRILDEVSLFLHLVEGGQEKEPVRVMGRMGALEEILKNKTVLVADDDVRNIFSLTRALEAHKMKVLSAMDGKEALAALDEGAFAVDIILMDMMMPEMDGFETISRIRKNPRSRDIPIIAVTAKAMAGDRERCIQAGASDYISKPVDLDQLMSLLRIWLYEK